MMLQKLLLGFPVWMTSQKSLQAVGASTIIAGEYATILDRKKAANLT